MSSEDPIEPDEEAGSPLPKPWEVRKSLLGFVTQSGLYNILTATRGVREGAYHLLKSITDIPGVGLLSNSLIMVARVEAFTKEHLAERVVANEKGLWCSPDILALLRGSGGVEILEVEDNRTLCLELSEEGDMDARTIATVLSSEGDLTHNTTWFRPGPRWTPWWKAQLKIQMLGFDDSLAFTTKVVPDLFHADREMKFIVRALETNRRILLLGPPGTGKTSLVSAISASLNLNVLQVHGAVSNAGVLDFLEMLGPGIIDAIFLDDIDTWPDGDVKLLLDRLKAANLKPFVFMTANHLRDLDPVLLRPGRIDKVIEVDLPDREARQAILEAFLVRLGYAVTPEQMVKLLQVTEGLSQAYLENIAAQLRQPFDEALAHIQDLNRLQASVSLEDKVRISLKLRAKASGALTVSEIQALASEKELAAEPEWCDDGED